MDNKVKIRNKLLDHNFIHNVEVILGKLGIIWHLTFLRIGVRGLIPH